MLPAPGREFSYALLRAVSRLPENELQTALARLIASELVFQRGTPPEAVYTFKHALVQDAAHGSLLRSSRQQLHAQTPLGKPEFQVGSMRFVRRAGDDACLGKRRVLAAATKRGSWPAQVKVISPVWGAQNL